jgi:predicted secreted protein
MDEKDKRDSSAIAKAIRAQLLRRHGTLPDEDEIIEPSDPSDSQEPRKVVRKVIVRRVVKTPRMWGVLEWPQCVFTIILFYILCYFVLFLNIPYTGKEQRTTLWGFWETAPAVPQMTELQCFVLAAQITAILIFGFLTVRKGFPLILRCVCGALAILILLSIPKLLYDTSMLTSLLVFLFFVIVMGVAIFLEISRPEPVEPKIYCKGCGYYVGRRDETPDVCPSCKLNRFTTDPKIYGRMRRKR